MHILKNQLKELHYRKLQKTSNREVHKHNMEKHAKKTLIPITKMDTTCETSKKRKRTAVKSPLLV